MEEKVHLLIEIVNKMCLFQEILRVKKIQIQSRMRKHPSIFISNALVLWLIRIKPTEKGSNQRKHLSTDTF